MKPIVILLLNIALWLSACKQNNTAVAFNEKAALPASFNINNLGLRVITSSINKTKGTMSILYGNDTALQLAMRSPGRVQPGQVLTLVTWEQQEDAHWFGGKIPGAPSSVETIHVLKDGHSTVDYQRWEGKDLVLTQDIKDKPARISYMINLQPSILP